MAFAMARTPSPSAGNFDKAVGIRSSHRPAASECLKNPNRMRRRLPLLLLVVALRAANASAQSVTSDSPPALTTDSTASDISQRRTARARNVRAGVSVRHSGSDDRQRLLRAGQPDTRAGYREDHSKDVVEQHEDRRERDSVLTVPRSINTFRPFSHGRTDQNAGNVRWGYVLGTAKFTRSLLARSPFSTHRLAFEFWLWSRPSS